MLVFIQQLVNKIRDKEEPLDAFAPLDYDKAYKFLHRGDDKVSAQAQEAQVSQELKAIINKKSEITEKEKLYIFDYMKRKVRAPASNKEPLGDYEQNLIIIISSFFEYGYLSKSDQDSSAVVQHQWDLISKFFLNYSSVDFVACTLTQECTRSECVLAWVTLMLNETNALYYCFHEIFLNKEFLSYYDKSNSYFINNQIELLDVARRLYQSKLTRVNIELSNRYSEYIAENKKKGAKQGLLEFKNNSKYDQKISEEERKNYQYLNETENDLFKQVLQQIEGNPGQETEENNLSKPELNKITEVTEKSIAYVEEVKYQKSKFKPKQIEIMIDEVSIRQPLTRKKSIKYEFFDNEEQYAEEQTPPEEQIRTQIQQYQNMKAIPKKNQGHFKMQSMYEQNPQGHFTKSRGSLGNIQAKKSNPTGTGLNHYSNNSISYQKSRNMSKGENFNAQNGNQIIKNRNSLRNQTYNYGIGGSLSIRHSPTSKLTKGMTFFQDQDDFYHHQVKNVVKPKISSGSDNKLLLVMQSLKPQQQQINTVLNNYQTRRSTPKGNANDEAYLNSDYVYENEFTKFLESKEYTSKKVQKFFAKLHKGRDVKNFCHNCGKIFTLGDYFTRCFCNFCMEYVCSKECQSLDKFIIPRQFDLEYELNEKNVCQLSSIFLNKRNYIKFNTSHPQLKQQPNLQDLMVFRRKLHKMFDCIKCEAWINIIEKNGMQCDKNFILKDCYLSIQQLSGLKTGQLEAKMKNMQEIFSKHFIGCVICDLRKQQCEICMGGVTFYDFDIKMAGQCNECKIKAHLSCLKDHQCKSFSDN